MKFLPRLLAIASLILPLGTFAAGAIAVDDAQGIPVAGYGVIIGAKSREQAANEALAECGRQGNRSCRVAVRFDKCGAYAASSNNTGAGFGRSPHMAKTMAMGECGTDTCKVLVARCE